MSRGNHGRWPCPTCGYKPAHRDEHEPAPTPPPGVSPERDIASITRLFTTIRPDLADTPSVGARLAAAAGENA